MNELLLIATLLLTYGSILLTFRYFGGTGLYVMNSVITILANIEVLVVVDAFGIEQTLGNVLFATTFLVTDILSETSGKKAARRAVLIGVASLTFFLILTQLWVRYLPSESDWAMPSIQTLFSFAPRTIGASLAVYILSQQFDVWIYHQWWNLTERLSGSHRSWLWVRNNGSTMISQLINTVVFTLLAFYGVYDTDTLVSIMLSTYIVYFIISILDTPVIYLARRINEKRQNVTPQQ